MASTALSKRQQARNERTLQELIKTVPGNSTCADCGARNPGWASWNLGVFLCMRCAGCHRKLGTHVSKVKSLSMDQWTNDQVEVMKKIGNTVSNRKYNPTNSRPPIPIDADEADSAMERFIRQKYQDQAMGGGRPMNSAAHHYSGSTESDDHPPPLPPKEKSRFGFRSASSIFPMSSKAKREAAATAHLEAQRQYNRSPSPPLRNKPSRVFGSKIASDDTELEGKLAKLRDMGFSDDKRNMAVLKGVNGNMEKSIETLVRLGEGNSTKSGHLTPTTPSTSGITIDRRREVASPASSSNPWEVPSAPLQSSQSTGNVQLRAQERQQMNGNPFPTNSTNPFGLMPSQSQSNLNQQYRVDQAFQNLSINGQPSTLFPNHTGGFPNRQPFAQATAPPPMPSIPQNYAPSTFDASPQQQQHFNPFFQQQNAPQQSQQPPLNLTTNGNFSQNPYSQQSPTYANPYAAQTQPASSNPFGIMQQSPVSYTPQQSIYDQPVQQSQFFAGQVQPQQVQTPPAQAFQSNPFNAPQFSQPQPQLQQQQQYTYPPQSQSYLQPQQTGRADKSSIMALFSQPQLAPIPQAQVLPDPVHDQAAAQSQNQAQNPVQQRSFSTPLMSYGATPNNTAPTTTNNTNPFNMSSSNAGFPTQQNQPVQNGAQAGRNVSRESALMDMSWMGQSGRHSPDAFSGLSARALR